MLADVEWMPALDAGSLLTAGRVSLTEWASVGVAWDFMSPTKHFNRKW